MNGLTVGLVWALSMVSLLIGYHLGRKSLPDIYEQTQNINVEGKPSLGDRIRGAMPGGGKGEVVSMTDEQLAELERISKGEDAPHDPNDGIPGYPG